MVAETLVSELFQPRELRGRLQYPSLASHRFTNVEKVAMVEMLGSENANGKKITEHSLSCRYNIKRRTIRDWKDRYDKGLYLHEGNGRPPCLDEESKENIKNKLAERLEEKNPPDKVAMREILADEVNCTGTRQNRCIPEPSPNTVERYYEELDISRVTPQIVAPHRYVACTDVRMSWTMWIMIKTLTHDIIYPQLIWNWDATQFIVSQSDKVRKVFSIKLDDSSRKNAPLSLIGQETLDIGIKWMHMGSASGSAVPLVLLVAVDAMKPTDFFFHEIRGLSATVSTTAVGYLCFCPTRVGNAKFFSWFLQNIAISAIENAQDSCSRSSSSTGSRPHAFATCDGEAIVLEEVFNKETRRILKEKNIDIGKISASCSGIHQPSDVSPLFRASKSRLRGLLSNVVIPSNPLVQEHILSAFTELKEVYHISVPSSQQEKVIYGCSAVMVAIQDVIKPKLIQTGFSRCGHFPCSYEKIMSQCYKKMTREELENLHQRTDDAVDFFRAHGYLSEEQMDLSEIPDNDPDRNVPRDQGALHHQRATCLTHRETVDRREARANAGLPLGNLITDSSDTNEEKKKKQRAIQLVARRRQKEERAAKEKERIAKMTPAELLLEKQQKEREKQVRKKRKTDEMAEAELIVQDMADMVKKQKVGSFE